MLFRMKTRFSQFTYPSLLLAAGLALLAAEPLAWLVNSWLDPSYASDGLWVVLLFAALSWWSLGSSRRDEATPQRRRMALLLLLASALVRLTGQLLAINVIGALTLVVDVYAIGRLLRLDQRQRPLAPFWLALLFAGTLPLERILQRTLGFVLQQLSAWSACGLLTWLDPGIRCNGTRIQLPGEALLIDLPCSGASALVLYAVLLCALLAVGRPTWRQGLLAWWCVPLAAWIANSLRILLLALGVLYPIDGIAVLHQPWHELVGLLALLPGLALLWWLFQAIPRPRPTVRSLLPLPGRGDGQTGPGLGRRFAPAAAVTFLLLALLIVTRTPRPLDAGPLLEPPYAPRYLAGEYGQPVPLLAKEQAYFERYGGAATKMRYGERGLLITRTASPLRHLHAPDECLRGLGFAVEYLGSHAALLPTAVYRATAPDGSRWRVSVSFVAAGGETASNVAEAVWHWLRSPQPWMALQRTAPWDNPPADDAGWDLQLFSALDLPIGAGPHFQPNEE
jgi:exosortase/archaeosortase family protein